MSPFVRLRHYLATKAAGIEFVRRAIAEKADLSAFKEKPTARIISGVSLIGFSYVLGWPSVIGLGAVAACLKKPLIVVIGGPLVYGLSHLVFLLGMYLAGARYSLIFCRWAARVSVEKMLPESGDGSGYCPPSQN